MAGTRQPIDLLLVKGKKHLTKAEIEQRRASEPKPCTDNIVAPAYLTAAQKKRFDTLAGQLVKIKIMGETDCETLARYVVAQSMYEEAAKDVRKVQKQCPKDATPELLMAWAGAMEKLDKRLERYFKQAAAMARDLGLTISHRCRLQVPTVDEAPKSNKFARFSEKAGGGNG